MTVWTTTAPFGAGGYANGCASGPAGLLMAVGFNADGSQQAALSTDGGQTWVFTGTPPLGNPGYATGCAIRSDGRLLVVGQDASGDGDVLAFSDDGGATWTTVNVFGGTGSDFALGIATHTDGTILVCGANAGNTQQTAVTTDDGSTWTRRGPFFIGGSGGTGNCCDIANDGTMLLGGSTAHASHVNVAVSTDGGSTWTTYTPFPAGFGPGGDCVGCRATDSELLVAGARTDPDASQFGHSEDAGASFTVTEPFVAVGNGTGSDVDLIPGGDLLQVLVSGYEDSNTYQAAITEDAGATWELTSPFGAGGSALGCTVSSEGVMLVIGNDSGAPDAQAAVAPVPAVQVPQREEYYGARRWKWIVTDLRTTRLLTVITSFATDLTATRILHDSWPATATVPADDPRVRTVYEGDTFDEPFVAEGVRCLVGFRDTGTDPLWEPAITTMILQANDEVQDGIPVTILSAWDLRYYLTIGCRVFDAAGNLPGQNGYSFTGTKANVIARALLTNLATAGYDDLISDVLDTGGTDTDCAEIDITFDRGTSIGDAWTQLEETGAIDIVLTPMWDPRGNPGKLWQLSTVPQAGSERNAALFSWDRSPRSLGSISRLEDGTKRANVIQFYDSNGVRVTLATDATSRTKFGPYFAEEAFPQKIADVEVTAFAAFVLALRKDGQEVVQLDPVTQRARQAVQDYDIGDRVPVYASESLRKPIAGISRIYAIPFVIGEGASETVDQLVVSANGT